MKPPNNLKTIIEFTGRHFRKRGEINPTVVYITRHGVRTEEHEIKDDMDTFRVADRMVAAAMDGASAVAFIAQGRTRGISERDRDPSGKKVIMISYEEVQAAYSCRCYINPQPYGPPRLSKWTVGTVRPNKKAAGRLQRIFERAGIRAKTSLTCEVGEAELMLVMSSDGVCLKNDAGEALVVSSELMARESIERWTEGGDFRCVPTKDHLKMIVGANGFHATGTDKSYSVCPGRIDDLRIAWGQAKDIMK